MGWLSRPCAAFWPAHMCKEKSPRWRQSIIGNHRLRGRSQRELFLDRRISIVAASAGVKIKRLRVEQVARRSVFLSNGNFRDNQMKDVAAVPGIDLHRYLGTWFEICRLPLKWEDAEASDITATYSKAADGGIKVENRCLDNHGTPERSIGVAVPQDDNNAKFRVSFLAAYLRWIPFTTGDYWVLAIAPDYSIALVGTPDRKNLG